MRNANRNAKALAILSAAAGLAVTSQFGRAALNDATWVGGTTGNWSLATNWQGGIAPANADVTNLTFPGGAAYTTTNDLGAFSFNLMTVVNAGANQITMTGGALNTLAV